MNIFKWLGVLFKVRGPAEDLIKEARTMNGTKPGWKTTEFYFSLLTTLGTVVAALTGVIPADLAAKISVGLTAVYTIGRSVVKAIQDVKAAAPTPAA